MSIICKRCGLGWQNCSHPPTCRAGIDEIDEQWAQRIRAAYALGRRHNPSHDTTSYAEQTRNG